MQWEIAAARSVSGTASHATALQLWMQKHPTEDNAANSLKIMWILLGITQFRSPVWAVLLITVNIFSEFRSERNSESFWFAVTPWLLCGWRTALFLLVLQIYGFLRPKSTGDRDDHDHPAVTPWTAQSHSPIPQPVDLTERPVKGLEKVKPNILIYIYDISKKTWKVYSE